MAKINPIIKDKIESLEKKELQKLVLKAASTSKQFHDYLLINYIDKEYGEQDLFDAAKSDLYMLYRKSYKGYSKELQLANMFAACNKRINEFGKVCRNKALEMELILDVLEIPFSNSSNSFTTCFTKYNYQVYLLLKKAITILKTKLHEDYHIQYAPRLNEYLTVLHRTSSHLDYIYLLPKSI
mgnify:FL=1